jgi:hypothetical protein
MTGRATGPTGGVAEEGGEAPVHPIGGGAITIASMTGAAKSPTRAGAKGKTRGTVLSVSQRKKRMKGNSAEGTSRFIPGAATTALPIPRTTIARRPAILKGTTTAPGTVHHPPRSRKTTRDRGPRRDPNGTKKGWK